MKILALDTATKTGFAHSCGESGIVDLNCLQESPGGKWSGFRFWLREFIELHPTDGIVYEMPFAFKTYDAAHSAHSLVAQVEEIASEYEGLWIERRNGSTIKKYATGNGRAKKPEMVAAAKAKWPAVEIVDDNHADALWLLDLVQSELTPNP